MPETCVVIPCFNEERRLGGDEILDFLHHHQNVTICFVDDGSSDGTLARIDAIKERAPKAVMALSLPVNRGKAEAVRRGVLYVATLNRFALIGYWDADMSTPLTELTAIIGVFEANPSCTLAMGSRVRRLGANIHRSAVRHYLGRVFSTAASLLLNLPVYDSQCGAKVVRADLVPVLFQDSFLTKWLFDVEILARLRNLIGRVSVLDVVTEVPLNVWIEMGESTLRPSDVARVPIDLLRIARHYNGKLAHKAPFSQLNSPPDRLGSSDTTRGTRIP
jgi:dolichyl-phosphate beta-glucosyltransferase